jgi:class 3 adenylate cyclase
MDPTKAKVSHPKDRDFSFARKRGVVWVCDIAGSSRYLNDDASAQDLEDFLPRLYRTAAIMVEAAGGEFIKWTGDGFLAWFEVSLHRDLKRIASAVFEAAFHLTLFTNVTQLGVATGKKKFKLRHGVAYEKDALVTTIKSEDGATLTDLIGRDVVFAFRLSGIEAEFPSIVTQKELAVAHREHAPSHINFSAWRPSKEDRLKFFKGEARGLSSICVTGRRKRRSVSKQTALKRSKSAIAAAEGRQPAKYPFHEVWDRFDSVFLSGPHWCREVMAEYLRFISEDLLGSLKGVVAALEDVGADEQPHRRIGGGG